MSDDLINQITLNFLISKQQLQKLNKKLKQKEEDVLKTDMEIYKDQIVELFTKIINDELPDDLLEDVKHSYNYFIEKSIYYLKIRLQADSLEDAVVNLEEESVVNLEDDSVVNLEEDISASDEDEDISASDEDDSLKEEESVVNLEEDSVVNLEEDAPGCKTVYKKNNKNTKSKGVDNIQQLPLDWFNQVRQTYKQNHIIPRQKDKEFVLESPTNYKNIEKKNISNLYEDKIKNKKGTK